jgi:hypothetical protein
MGLPERYRAQVPGERQVAAILTRGQVDQARVDADAQVVGAVLEGISDVGDRALLDTAMLAHRTELLADRNALAQASLAGVFDQCALEIQLTLHRGAERIRRAGGC